jgi:hypothetical protein
MFPCCFNTSGHPEIFEKRIVALAEKRAKLLAEIKAQLEGK